MRVLSMALPGLVLALASAGCSFHRDPGGSALNRNLLTREQFSDKGYTTAYDLVAALRSNWLSTRGPDSFQSPSQVMVYLDGVRMGGIDALRSIDLRPVTYIRYFDGVTATARWG